LSWLIQQIRPISTPALTGVFSSLPTAVQPGINTALVCPTSLYLILRSAPTVTYVQRHTGADSTKLLRLREVPFTQRTFGESLKLRCRQAWREPLVGVCAPRLGGRAERPRRTSLEKHSLTVTLPQPRQVRAEPVAHRGRDCSLGAAACLVQAQQASPRFDVLEFGSAKNHERHSVLLGLSS